VPIDVDGERNRADLGSALRSLRVERDLTADRLAVRVHMSPAKLSKIENGRVAPSALDVERILTALDVGLDVRDEVIRLAQAASTDYRTWREYRRLGLSLKQREVAALEAQTRQLRLFQHALIPGLLQIDRYMSAVLAMDNPEQDEVARAVEERQRRTAVLTDESKQFVIITTESALRWRVADNQVMGDQLEHLVEVSRSPNVRLGVVPLAVRAGEVPLTSFCLYDERLCTIETFSGEVVFRDPRDVAIHQETFRRFEQLAAFDDSARAILGTVGMQYRLADS
jgi:transcriptional regulator with XRE-family HTH domain